MDGRFALPKRLSSPIDGQSPEQPPTYYGKCESLSLYATLEFLGGYCLEQDVIPLVSESSNLVVFGLSLGLSILQDIIAWHLFYLPVLSVKRSTCGWYSTMEATIQNNAIERLLTNMTHSFETFNR
jgi:hypothetical protein